MNELVSVIIPVFNVRPYLEEALDSVIHQSYENLEIIIINDGSNDGSGEICDEYAVKDKRIRVIHQENRGLSAARNAGLDCMTGDYVAFLDPDDAYDENGEPKYAITYPFGKHPTPEETMIAMLQTIAANGGYIPGTEHKEIEMLEFDDSGNIIGEEEKKEEKKEETEEETDDTIPADMREEVIENK